jgi:hypothetical protein
VTRAAKTLGIHLAANRDTTAQEEYMIKKASEWVASMKEGSLSRQEIRIALNSTIMRTLIHPLPALNLTKKQCE